MMVRVYGVPISNILNDNKYLLKELESKDNEIFKLNQEINRLKNEMNTKQSNYISIIDTLNTKIKSLTNNENNKIIKQKINEVLNLL